MYQKYANRLPLYRQEAWLDQQKPVRNIRMDKAVNDVLNRRDTAETYLEGGRCSFTNRLSENAFRPFAVDRKNWLNWHLGGKTAIYQKPHMNYSELLQLAKDWGNFVSDRINIYIGI